VRHLGSARNGSQEWRLQRRTALALVPLGLYFVASMLRLATSDHISAAVTVDDDSLLWNVALVSALDHADQAVVIAQSACARTESRGAHAREDYHQRDDKNWLKHTVAWKDEDWNVRFAYRPVHLNTLSNEVQSFPPAERTH
jgi:hypothetical protein